MPGPPGPRSGARSPRAPRIPTRSASRSRAPPPRPPRAPPSGGGGPRATRAGTRSFRAPGARPPRSRHRAPTGRPSPGTRDRPGSAPARPRRARIQELRQDERVAQHEAARRARSGVPQETSSASRAGRHAGPGSSTTDAASSGAARVMTAGSSSSRSYYAASSGLRTRDGASGPPPHPSNVRGDGGRLLTQRTPERPRQLDVVLVGHREDPALRDLARQVLQDLGERLFRDALEESYT